MKPLVIYHANCADGFGAAFAAWLKLGDNAEYVPRQYGAQANDSDMDVSHRDVYVLDFSFPRLVMGRLFSTAKRVVWLDHHKTAFEMWCGSYVKGMVHDDRRDPHHICLDDNKSGAILAWEFFHPGEEIPMFIRHIDDYDRWQFKLEGTKAFNKALWSMTPWTFRQWAAEWDRTWGFSNSAGTEGLPKFLALGEAILRAHDQNVQSVVKGAARGCILPAGRNDSGQEMFNEHRLIGLAANCPPHLASDVGHELAKNSGTFGLLWYINKDGKCLCSLRSNGDYDVSGIAKAFGGGGHRNASGFEVDVQTLLGWIK